MPLLPFKLNQAGRHHIPRQRHKVTNWPAYEAGLRPGDTRLVLSPTSQFFRYFNDAMGRGNTPAPGSGTPDPAATSSTAPPR